MCMVNQDHMRNRSWDIQCKGQSFLYFGPPLPFDPASNTKNQNFDKMKKQTSWRYILPKCTINDNHMICGSSDMKCTRKKFFAILGHLLPFYPLPLSPLPLPLPPNSLKNKNEKKWKKTPEDIIILHKCTKNRD